MPASIELTTVRPTELTPELIARHQGEVINTDGWQVEQFVANLTLGQRWCAVCACCSTPVGSCKNNASVHEKWGAIAWTTWYANRVKTAAPAVVITTASPAHSLESIQASNEDDDVIVASAETVVIEEVAAPKPSPKTKQKAQATVLATPIAQTAVGAAIKADKVPFGRRKSVAALTEDQKPVVLAMWDAGWGRNEVKEFWNTEFQYMTDFLRENGKEVKPGVRRPRLPMSIADFGPLAVKQLDYIKTLPRPATTYLKPEIFA